MPTKTKTIRGQCLGPYQVLIEVPDDFDTELAEAAIEYWNVPPAQRPDMFRNVVFSSQPLLHSGEEISNFIPTFDGDDAVNIRLLNRNAIRERLDAVLDKVEGDLETHDSIEIDARHGTITVTDLKLKNGQLFGDFGGYEEEFGTNDILHEQDMILLIEAIERTTNQHKK
jgi:hypothetical protein